MEQKKSCCFFGHRKIKESDELKSRLSKTIEELIVNHSVKNFLFGSRSEFDELCYKVATELKEKYNNIQRVYVRAEYPYVTDCYKKYLLEMYEDTYYPEKIKNAGRPIKVLNLFAYTGGATLAAAAAGAQVTHVDASKGMVAWAKENAVSSGLKDAPIRWLVDDCVKFVEREIRRGNKYDAIIMDPPSYGRGPKGEIWKIEDSIHSFIKLCTNILSDEPLFFLVNSYTTGLAPAVLTYMLSTELKDYNGTVESQEIGLPVKNTGLVLPCGASAFWQK